MTSATAATCADPLRRQSSPPRRRGPRPLALHLALAAAAARARPAADGSLPARFLAGLHAYWRHPYRRDLAEPPALWSEGATRLLDYGPADGLPLLVVPSLINRAYILDLMPGRSLLRHLAEQGLRPLSGRLGRSRAGRAAHEPRGLPARAARGGARCGPQRDAPAPGAARLLHGWPLGGRAGGAPAARPRGPRLAGDALGFPRRAAGARVAAAARRVGDRRRARAAACRSS